MGFMGHLPKLWDEMGQFLKIWDLWDLWDGWEDCILFNLSVTNSYAPRQWKQASILPIPKTFSPALHADFRPISINPVLTCVMERTVVKRFLYPAFMSPPPTY